MAKTKKKQKQTYRPERLAREVESLALPAGMKQAFLNTGRELGKQELAREVEKAFNRIFSRSMTNQGTVASLKITSILDEINHLNIDYLPSVRQAAERTTDEQVLSVVIQENPGIRINTKLTREVRLLAERERAVYVRNALKLAETCRENNRYVESLSEERQDLICEVAEMALDQIEMRKGAFLTPRKVGHVIRDSRQREGLTEGQLAHQAKTNVQALALLEMGVMAELDTLVARMNRVLAPLGYNVEPVFRLFNNGLDYGRAEKDPDEGV